MSDTLTFIYVRTGVVKGGSVVLILPHHIGERIAASLHEARMPGEVLHCLLQVLKVTVMKAGTREKWLFWLTAGYLPSSILLVFWLYAVSLLYPPDNSLYRLFYGQDGNIALLWLFAILLPAVVLLVANSSGWKTHARLSGATGFYCLLGASLSAHGYLAIPGFAFLLISIVIRRRHKQKNGDHE